MATPYMKIVFIMNCEHLHIMLWLSWGIMHVIIIYENALYFIGYTITHYGLFTGCIISNIHNIPILFGQCRKFSTSLYNFTTYYKNFHTKQIYKIISFSTPHRITKFCNIPQHFTAHYKVTTNFITLQHAANIYNKI